MGIFADIAYYNIFGIPLLVYGGIITVILLLCTAVIGWLVMNGKVKFSWHKALAIITVLFALGHGFLAFASRFIG
jgi:hypothetical protein